MQYCSNVNIYTLKYSWVTWVTRQYNIYNIINIYYTCVGFKMQLELLTYISTIVKFHYTHTHTTVKHTDRQTDRHTHTYSYSHYSEKCTKGILICQKSLEDMLMRLFPLLHFCVLWCWGKNDFFYVFGGFICHSYHIQ